jgi:hypothetical protein
MPSESAAVPSYLGDDDAPTSDRRIRHRRATAEQAERDRRVLARLYEVLPLVTPQPDAADFMTGVAVALLVLREDENALTPEAPDAN